MSHEEGGKKQTAAIVGNLGPRAILLHGVSMSNRNSLEALVEKSTETRGIPIVILNNADLNASVGEILTSSSISERATAVPLDDNTSHIFVHVPSIVPIVYFSGLDRETIKDLIKNLRVSGFLGAFAMAVPPARDRAIGEVFEAISEDWREQNAGR